MSGYTHQMADLPPEKQAEKAIAHMLQRICESPEVGYYCGIATQCFDLLTEAYATLTARDLDRVRATFEPKAPRDPAKGQPAWTATCDTPVEDRITEFSAVGWLERITPGERLSFFLAMRRFCLRCGCDNVGAVGCGCRIGRRAA